MPQPAHAIAGLALARGVLTHLGWRVETTRIASTSSSISCGRPYSWCCFDSGNEMATHTILHRVLERISARDPREVTLSLGRNEVAPYTARCRERSAQVDRVLAVELRGAGARWSGDISSDPCAVA